MAQDRQAELKLVYDHAVKFLSLRLHTAVELKRKLLQRNYGKSYIEEVIGRLTELNVLNDERFAEIFLDNLIRYKTFGYYGLKMKLLQRGIPGGIIQKLLEENLSIEAEIKIAQKFIGKSHKEKDKISQSLNRKGFRREVIAKVLQNMV